jgi:hypothetical protein
LTRHWRYLSKTHLGNSVSRPTFTSKKLLRKYYRGLQPKSHRGIASQLLLDLETGVILVTALYEDIAEDKFKK